MQLGVIDLGPLGADLVRRLLAGGHRCVVFDRSPKVVAEFGAEKAYGAASLADLVHELDAPRAIWLAGPAVTADATIADLLPHLEAEDIIVECSDSYYVDDICRATELAAVGIHYVDVGVSGVLGRPERGHCLTIGGEEAVVGYLDPVFRELAEGSVRPSPGDLTGGTAPLGYLHCGPAGAGHFVKMVHDSIERCLIAAYAEGFSILRAANVRRNDRSIDSNSRRVTHPERYQYDFRLGEIAEVWRHGSLVGSRVLDLATRGLARDATLGDVLGTVVHAPEDWLPIRAAVNEAVLTPVLSAAMYMGFGSRNEGDFSSKLLAAVRQESSPAGETKKGRRQQVTAAGSE